MVLKPATWQIKQTRQDKKQTRQETDRQEDTRQTRGSSMAAARQQRGSNAARAERRVDGLEVEVVRCKAYHDMYMGFYNAHGTWTCPWYMLR